MDSSPLYTYLAPVKTEFAKSIILSTRLILIVSNPIKIVIVVVVIVVFVKEKVGLKTF